MVALLCIILYYISLCIVYMPPTVLLLCVQSIPSLNEPNKCIICRLISNLQENCLHQCVFIYKLACCVPTPLSYTLAWAASSGTPSFSNPSHTHPIHSGYQLAFHCNSDFLRLLPTDKTVKLWKVSERDKRPEGYNLKDEEGRLRDPATITTLRVSFMATCVLLLFSGPPGGARKGLFR